MIGDILTKGVKNIYEKSKGRYLSFAFVFKQPIVPAEYAKCTGYAGNEL